MVSTEESVEAAQKYLKYWGNIDKDFEIGAFNLFTKEDLNNIQKARNKKNIKHAKAWLRIYR